MPHLYLCEKSDTKWPDTSTTIKQLDNYRSVTLVNSNRDLGEVFQQSEDFHVGNVTFKNTQICLFSSFPSVFRLAWNLFWMCASGCWGSVGHASFALTSSFRRYTVIRSHLIIFECRRSRSHCHRCTMVHSCNKSAQRISSLIRCKWFSCKAEVQQLSQ